jgi:hypothetical protein
MKSELLTFPKDQNRIRNARNTCFKRWKYGSGNWGYNVTDHKHKTNSGHFMSLFKRRTASTFASEIWGLQTRHWPQIIKERHLV